MHLLVTPTQLIRLSLVSRLISFFLYEKEPEYEARCDLVLAETQSAQWVTLPDI